MVVLLRIDGSKLSKLGPVLVASLLKARYKIATLFPEMHDRDCKYRNLATRHITDL
jgi:hypothetical protein